MTAKVSAGEAHPDRLIRLSEVIEIVGYRKAMIYRKVRAGTFQKPSAWRTA